MSLIAASIIVAAAVLWTGRQIIHELRIARDEAAHARALAVLTMFSPGIAAARGEPRELLTWYPLARTARQLLPAEFASLDAASGSTFPFARDRVEAAHAQWSADWLSWERAHDSEYKMKAAALEHELFVSGGSPRLRAELDAVEREKLDLYQRRYQEYVTVAKALQALLS